MNLLRLSFCSILALIASAEARSQFPGQVNSKYGVNSTDCVACHTSPPSFNAFGRRVSGALTGTLSQALDALEANDVDTDGDGTKDIAELRLGRLPAVSDAPGSGGSSGTGGAGGTAGSRGTGQGGQGGSASGTGGSGSGGTVGTGGRAGSGGSSADVQDEGSGGCQHSSTQMLLAGALAMFALARTRRRSLVE